MPHRVVGRRAWLVLPVAIVVLAAHAVALHLVSSRLALPGTIAVGAMVLLLAKHLGAVGWVVGEFRRRQRR